MTAARPESLEPVERQSIEHEVGEGGRDSCIGAKSLRELPDEQLFGLGELGCRERFLAHILDHREHLAYAVNRVRGLERSRHGERSALTAEPVPRTNPIRVAELLAEAVVEA